MIKQQASEDQTAVAQNLWKVSISPHVKSSESVEKIMWTVVACLVPPLVLSVFVFGIQVLFITAVSVVSCVVVEAISQKALKRPVTGSTPRHPMSYRRVFRWPPSPTSWP